MFLYITVRCFTFINGLFEYLPFLESNYGGVQLSTGPFRNKWPALSSTPSTPARPNSHWTTSNTRALVPKRKTAEDYAKDRVGKYAQYFEKKLDPVNTSACRGSGVESHILRLIRLDDQEIGRVKERDLRGDLKDGGRPISVHLPAKFRHVRRPAAVGWSSQNADRGNNNNEVFRLQHEYKDHRRIKVTVCNIPIELNGDVLAVYLSAYSDVEEVLQARSVARTVHRDYIINICLDREGFHAILHIIAYKDQNMIVVVKGRKPLCWACKQIDHFARSCPQKTTKSTATTAEATAETSATSPSKSDLEPENHPDKEEG